jgi:hypothetical protein
MAARRPFAAVVALFLAAMPGLWSGALAADWPREVRSGDATIVLYQPQFDSLDGIDTRARIAVAIQRPGLAPEFGALWVAATLDVDRDEDTARFKTFEIERARFPDASEQEVRKLTALIEQTAPTWDLEMSLAELRAGLEAEGTNGDAGFRNDPPEIIYRDRPAILVTLDGEPRLQPVQGTTYQRVANTPFPIVFDPATRQYWLFGSAVWFTTRDLVRGPWSARDAAPSGIAALFSRSAEDPPLDAGEGVPKDQLRRAEIVVSTRPAELVATDGPPQYKPLVGDEMLYVTNTGSDLFLEVPTRYYYVVLSGRWYRSRALTGPWAYVEPDTVPRAFAEVPRKSDKAEVLAHVPGTDEAKDAVMDAMIPQTAPVRRGRAELEVTYDGVPRFERIPGTSLLYAQNTASQVLKVADRYYVVDQGVWYVSRSAYGPWEVADERPEEVERIPASSPAYNVKYVYIYDTTPDVVYVGYLPGYTWAFPYHGAIVYGTGWHYRPWYGPVVYYPRPATWGFHVHYTPWYGWGYGMSWSAGWVSLSWAWGDGWGGWGHGYYPPYRAGYRTGYRDGYRDGYWDGKHTGGWFGPGGYRPPHHDHWYAERRYEPRRGFRPPDRTQIASLPGIGGRPSARPRPVNNLYARSPATRDGARSGRGPGSDVIRPATRPQAPPDSRTGNNEPRGNRPGARPEDPPDGREARGSRRDTQPVPRANPRLPNNVFVDRDGIPYRVTRDGWQTRANREWRPAPELDRAARPATPRPDRSPSPREPYPSRTDRPDRGNAPARGPGQRQTQPPPAEYRRSPPVDFRRQPPETPRRDSRSESGGRDTPRAEPPGADARRSLDGGWGNRAGPRDGPSLRASEHARTRSNGGGVDRGRGGGDRGERGQRGERR